MFVFRLVLPIHVILVLSIEEDTTTLRQDVPREFACGDFLVILASGWLIDQAKLLLLHRPSLHTIAHAPYAFVLANEHCMVVLNMDTLCKH